MADKTTSDNEEVSNGLPFNELDHPSLDDLHTPPATLHDLIKSGGTTLPVSLMTSRHYNEWNASKIQPRPNEGADSDMYSLDLPSPQNRQNCSIPVLETPLNDQIVSNERLQDADRSSLLSFLTANHA